MKNSVEDKSAGASLGRLRALLPEMTAAELQSLARELPLEEVEVVKPPHSGTIMAAVRDCFKTDFYLGEVLVSRAEVRYAGQYAQATLIGDCPQAVLLVAVLEALAAHDGEDLLATVRRSAEEATQRITRRREREMSLAAATRVNFRSMAEEEPLI